MYSCLDLQLNKEYMCTNPLNTNIKIHSHLLSQSLIFNRSGGENFSKYQLVCVIMSSILMTTVFYEAVILQGEL